VVAVPQAAREAIVRIRLTEATGHLFVEDVSLKAERAGVAEQLSKRTRDAPAAKSSNVRSPQRLLRLLLDGWVRTAPGH